MARLVPRPLAQPVQGVHVHAERERARHLHRLEQPAEVGGVGRRGHVDGLLEVTVDAQLALPIGGMRGASEQLAQRAGRARRLARVRGGVELPEHLEPRPLHAGAALGRPVRGGRVEAPPEQLGDLGAR